MTRIGRFVVPGFPYHLAQRGNRLPAGLLRAFRLLSLSRSACRTRSQGVSRSVGLLPEAEPVRLVPRTRSCSTRSRRLDGIRHRAPALPFSSGELAGAGMGSTVRKPARPCNARHRIEVLSSGNRKWITSGNRDRVSPCRFGQSKLTVEEDRWFVFDLR
jgi:hypothetical protein